MQPVAPFPRRLDFSPHSNDVDRRSSVASSFDSIDFSAPLSSASQASSASSVTTGASATTQKRDAGSIYSSTTKAGQWRGKPLQPARRRLFSRALMSLCVLSAVSVAILQWRLVWSTKIPRFSIRSPRRADSLRMDEDGAHVFAAGDPSSNPHERHPIHTLIAEAKIAWQEKQDRQSKTFSDAVSEYRRRYRRAPPRGFAVWFEWAKSNHVQLLDEYDAIDESIRPYLALPPGEIRRRIEMLEDMDGIGKDFLVMTLFRGERTYDGATWRDDVGLAFDELLDDIAEMLPDLPVPLYLHDASFTHLDYDTMQAYIKAANAGRYVDEDMLPVPGASAPWTNRERTCAPNSVLRRAVQGLTPTIQHEGPAFIRDHALAMDYCRQPANVDLHGATSSHVQLGNLFPSFALSRTTTDGDVLWPSTIQYHLNPKHEKPFAEKTIHKIVWRGSPDGIAVAPDQKWRQSHRFRLLALTNSKDTQPRNIRLTAKDKQGRERQIDRSASLLQLNARYTNIRATGGPAQCTEELCSYLSKTMEFVPLASLEEMAEHRYVMDVDGNAYSARFRTHLHSYQVPFKSTIYKEWYYDRIQPWVHYVPVRIDYSDLFSILGFFDGGLDPHTREGNHDDLAEEIALAGRQWAGTHWRKVDMQAYLFRLLLEWARVLDFDRDTS